VTRPAADPTDPAVSKSRRPGPTGPACAERTAWSATATSTRPAIPPRLLGAIFSRAPDRAPGPRVSGWLRRSATSPLRRCPAHPAPSTPRIRAPTAWFLRRPGSCVGLSATAAAASARFGPRPRAHGSCWRASTAQPARSSPTPAPPGRGRPANAHEPAG